MNCAEPELDLPPLIDHKSMVLRCLALHQKEMVLARFILLVVLRLWVLNLAHGMQTFWAAGRSDVPC
jgi:hypothetical protein